MAHLRPNAFTDANQLPANRFVNLLYKLADQKAKGYIRQPHEVEVDLCFGNEEYIDQNKQIDKTRLKVTAVRRDMGNGLFAIICACEYIRRECNNRRSAYPSYALGKEPITIGLWIGNAHKRFPLFRDQTKR